VRYDDEVTYETPYDARSIIGHETPDDLLHVCRECHLAEHVVEWTGEFFADPRDAQSERDYVDHLLRPD